MEEYKGKTWQEIRNEIEERNRNGDDYVSYSVPRNTVDIKVVTLKGHQYIVGAIVGACQTPSKFVDTSIAGTGSGISLQHFAGCPCKNHNSIESC